MLRLSAAQAAALFVLLAGVCAVPASGAAQDWDDARTMSLVERATELRAAQLADSALVDYTAKAHGYVTFLAQMGEGFTEPPKVVKADELELEVYWRAPDMSKQRIIGRRDTLLAPSDIQYHRDHLGIVQNNFPNIIRIGDGDEVRDVPHPLSRLGLDEYEFAIRDSLALRLPTGTLQVYEVAVRPRDVTQPRIVGALYIDRTTAQVVRMAFDFTRPSYLDAQLEDISVVLENALVQGRFWLPRRQEIEIRRTGTWLDFPVRGIIRGRWEICCYSVNSGLQRAIFAGPEIVQAPRSVLARHVWQGRILDSLPPDVRAASEADVQRVKEEARKLVQAQALQRASGASLSARRISDFARVNRVEGLALGAGAQLRLGGGMSASITGRYGFDDHEPKGRASFEVRRATGPSLTLYALRDYQEMGDIAESSVLVNSFAAQELGTDRTDLYDVRAAGASLDLGRWRGLLWRLQGSHQEQGRLRVHATPWSGSYEPTVPAWSITEERIALGIERPLSMAFWGAELRARSELRWGWFDGRDTSFTTTQQYYGRAFVDVELQRPIGDDRLVLRTTLGAVDGTPDVPAQDYVFLGGPITGPGYDFHRFAGTFGASQRIEWRTRVPFVPISLGPYGRAPGSATLAPYFHTVYVSGSAPFAERARGWYPSVGMGVYVLFDLLRFDVAKGLREGRWSFSVDLTRELWGIL
ncbi:MAG TPA: hypothetical protein VFK39_00745 [Gemmatimonadaceae bacterium]|nr:hypothetical protein [Gemmatimonadaceae bacterium]